MLLIVYQQMKVAIDRLLASRSATTSRQQVSLNDIPVAVFGSRAHLEQEALAKVWHGTRSNLFCSRFVTASVSALAVSI